jgi:cytochrome c553
MAVTTLRLRYLSIVVLLLTATEPGWASPNRGQTLFRLCAACHGNQGEGRQDVGAPAIAGLPEWYVTAQLQKFRQGVRGSHPQDSAGMRMRPMARTLATEDDVLDVAAYVARLPSPMPPAAVAGDVANGETQYLVCMACHGLDGKGNQPLMAPPLTVANDWYLLKQLQNFQNGVRGADPRRDATGSMMLAIARMLDEQAMKDVIAYIQTLR